jgi:hypothetical protein
MEACGPGLIQVLSQNCPGRIEKTAKNLSHDVGFKVFTAVIMEEFYLLAYNAVWYVESQPTFWRNKSPCLTYSSIPEDRGVLFLRDVR